MKSRMARAGVAGAMAIGAVVAVISFGAPGGAQADATTTIDNAGVDFAPAVSDDGRTIVFASSPVAEGSVPSLFVHERSPLDLDGEVLPDATTPIPDSLGATKPSISANGCIVTWSIPAVITETVPVQTTDARIDVLDRCVDPVADPADARVGLPLQDGDQSFGPAVPSSDGSVIAVSNGTDVLRFERIATGGYEETGRFDGSDTAATDHLVSERVDVSEDGSVVVFSGGLDLANIASMTVFAHVVGADEALTTPVLTSATSPTVSGDGTLVVGSTGSLGSSVALVDRTAVPLAPVDLGPGRRPAISSDGNHVVFEEGANLAMISRTGQGGKPFATTQRTLLSSTITPTRSGPVVDRLGATVVSDWVAEGATPVDTDIAITVVDADASFDAALFDLGAGDVGAVLTSTITFSNRGPASVGVADISVEGTFTIVEDRCSPVLRAGTTCEIDVSFTVERYEDAFGVVTLTPTTSGVAVYTTEVTALGEAPPVSTPSTTSTTPQSTGGSSTGGTTTRGTTGSTGGTTTSGGTTLGTSSTGGSTTGSTPTITTTTTTTTTLAPGAGVSASPAAFDFAPTIIDAGRRTGLVEIVNNGAGPITVTGVRLDPADAGSFQIFESTCAGAPVPVGARCGLTLAFAPTAIGPQSVSLIATLASGADITVAVTGIGAPPPTVEIVPGVANVGQVVTLSGAGFPTGITVDLLWGPTVRPVEVDEAGTFKVPVVVMLHTPNGPATVSVAGQTDLFGTVEGTVLVTHTSDRLGPPVIEGIGPNIGR